MSRDCYAVDQVEEKQETCVKKCCLKSLRAKSTEGTSLTQIQIFGLMP